MHPDPPHYVPLSCYALLGVALVCLALVLLTGCATLGQPVPDPALRAAQVSYVTYETLAPECQRETAALVTARRDRALTPPEQDRLDRLKTLGKALESYRQAHNIYIKTLAPLDRQKIVSLLNDCIDLGLSLGLHFNAVRISP